jgi:hypothetical protein
MTMVMAIEFAPGNPFPIPARDAPRNRFCNSRAGKPAARVSWGKAHFNQDHPRDPLSLEFVLEPVYRGLEIMTEDNFMKFFVLGVASAISHR